MSDAIRFVAAVQKVQTLADGGVRVTLDLPETAIPQMAMLAECQRGGVALEFEATEAVQEISNKRLSTQDYLHGKS